MNFQQIIIFIASILLILILTFIGYSLYNNQFNNEFPPVLGECPDFWVAKDKRCYNPKNLGNCTGPMDFNTSQFQGNNGNCEKANWATSCNVSWTGITNNPGVCDTDNA